MRDGAERRLGSQGPGARGPGWRVGPDGPGCCMPVLRPEKIVFFCIEGNISSRSRI